MTPVDRSVLRNTFIYTSKNRAEVQGGLWATSSVTNANLYSILEIFCSISCPYYLHDDSELVVGRNGQQLQPGNYYIFTDGSIVVTDEVPLNRQISLQTGTRVGSFRKAVRERDKGCVLSGMPARFAHVDRWRAFEAAHIFPLACQGKWNEYNYDSLIDIPPAIASHGPINSVQNGILLTSDIHHFFDADEVEINPDDNHKIVCFVSDHAIQHILGRRLDQRFIDNPLRPVDELLRWHFRQAVLTNVRGS